MSEPNKTGVTDVNGLADLFLETLRETKLSGNLVNRKTLAQFLARKKGVRDLLRFAKEREDNRIRTEKRQQLAESIKSVSPEVEAREKNAVDRAVDAEFRLDRERDFYKRFCLFMMKLSRTGWNREFFDIIDQYKKLLIDDAPIETREQAFGEFKNRMLKLDRPGEAPSDGADIAPEPAEPSFQRPSLLKRFLGESHDVKLHTMKDVLLKAMGEMRVSLGDRFGERYDTLETRIRDCDDIDYLLSLRKQVFGIIELYVSQVENERKEVAMFIKEIGRKLIEMEGDLIMTFSSTSQFAEEDSNFNRRLGDKIQQIGQTLEESRDFNDLKNVITSELKSLTIMLDDKRREYDERIQRSVQEKERIQEYFQGMVTHVIEQNKLLIEQSQRDGLTGIINRATFEEAFDMELHRYQRYQEPFAIVMFDIDSFKRVNDSYGHAAGDRVLKGVARCVSGVIRQTDLFARFGGEEFIIMMPQTDLDRGLIVAEKIRETIEHTEFVYEDTIVPVTASFGLTIVGDLDTGFKPVYTRVDELLYMAKNAGRNAIRSDADV